MIYLDYASTTPIRKEVLDTYMKVLHEYYGNSDSLHEIGRQTSKLLEQSRANIAQLLHIYSEEVIFTSCASESNNMAIKGFVLKHAHRGKHIITSSIEHSSVLKTMKQLEDVFGFEVTYLPVNQAGIVQTETLQKALRKDTILVSFMYVNNETGAINPIEKLAKIVHEYSRAVFHCDCVQAIGKLKIDLSYMDMATFSAHKIYGLKGSGLLYKKKNIQLLPLLSGGQQELGMRAGTSNAPTHIVMAKTLRLALEEQEMCFSYVKRLNDYMREQLSKMQDIVINSDKACSPFILNISCLRVGSEIMLNALNAKGFAVSAQSTCSSKSKARSYVLLEMGLGEERATHAIRISLSHKTTKEEVDAFIKAIQEVMFDYGT